MIYQITVSKDYFEDIAINAKPYIILRNDTHYVPGNLLALNEAFPDPEHFTGRCMLVSVKDVFTDPVYVKQGHAILSISPCKIILSPESRYHFCYDSEGQATDLFSE